MRLSIIIPTLNEAQCIGDAIGRARALAPLDIVVADGGSTDGTQEAARGRGAILVIAPPGRGTQLNAGARAAQGDLLLFLHADNWLEAPARDQLERAMADTRILGGAFRQRIEAAGWMYRLLEWGNAQRVLWWGTAYGDQAIFARRDLFERIGGFPETPIMEDLLFMRAFCRISRPRLLPGPVHVDARRWRRHGVIRQTLRNWALVSAFRLGVPPARLAPFYPRA